VYENSLQFVPAKRDLKIVPRCSGDGSIDESEFSKVCNSHGVAEAEAREAFKKLGVVSIIEKKDNKEKGKDEESSYTTSVTRMQLKVTVCLCAGHGGDPRQIRWTVEAILLLRRPERTWKLYIREDLFLTRSNRDRKRAYINIYIIYIYFRRCWLIITLCDRVTCWKKIEPRFR